MVVGFRGGNMNSTVTRRIRVAALISTVVALGALLVALPQQAIAGPATVTKTFAYTGATDTFTVPAGISALTVTIVGGEGGNGGADATPAPAAGGYRGMVTGTLAVTPNQVLTVAVGSHGGTGASKINANTAAAVGGANPLGGYAGGAGGHAGTNGSSGAGGAGGAASVLQVAGASVVAAGGGGSGGSGQYASTQGHTATAVYAGRTDTTSTSGQLGQNAAAACAASTCNNDDGGGSGGGGGGAQGGATGDIQFGAGSSNEWYGFGGSVGQNSTASLTGLTASYQYYADNATDGSIVISYTTGSPAAPTAVSGTAGNGSVSLLWTAPTDPGQSAISDYLVQYSSNGGSTWSSAVDMGSTAATGTITGLGNGTAYVFQVAAVNSVGTGAYSAASASVTPLGPPSAPSISLVTAQDGGLRLSLTAPSSGAAVTGYDYRVDGGSWVSVASASTTLVIPGLVNGTAYTVETRAQSAVGVGAISTPAAGTPLAVPGAPTISSLAVGNGSLTVAFTVGFNGGGAISSYQYRLNGVSWITATGTTSPLSIIGLAPGTAYAVELRAVNSAGAGAASVPANATTPGAPGTPNVSTVVAGDGSVTVNFTPGATGGTPVDHYEYQTATGGGWTDVSSTTSPITIGGLSNGASVAVSIRAVNAVGAGTASAPVTVTPATVPGAPAIVGDTVAGSDAHLSAEFTAPASDGGAGVLSYQYSTDGGVTWLDRADGGTTASPVVIAALSSDGSTPLTNGTTYFVELRAVNAIGAGTASDVAQGIATSKPDAPVVTSVTPAPGALSVVFTSPANGGSAITAFQYSVDGGAHWSSTGGLSASFTISSLVDGTAYGVQVRAVNSVGDGPASAAVTGTPVALPGQALIDSVVRSNQTLTSAVRVTDDGGAAISAWQYSTDGGATWATASGTASPLTLTVLSSATSTRLANGTGYALQVRAINAVGTGPASATTIVAPASAPSAPAVALTAGNGSIAVAFTLGTDGGSPVTALEYSFDGGSHWVDPGTLSSPFTIASLTNGTGYSLLLRVDNAIGDGASSVPASTTPRTVPGAPASVAAVSNGGSADISWSAPIATGGAAITGYTATAYLSGTATSSALSCTTAGATSCTITGLTNRTVYYVAVTATNAAGTGAASAPRVPVTPLARPSAPTLSSLTVGDGTISIAFSAGAIGDGTLTGYQYSIDGGVTWAAATGSSSPILLTGVTNGAPDTVALRAVSTAGVGATSNTLTATTYGYPSAPDPSTIVANGGDGKILVGWAAANLNGGTGATYTATAFSDPSGGSNLGTCSTTGLSCTIGSLTNGTTYYISLQTMNSVSMYSVRSAPRVPAIPSTKPGAPTAVTATAGNGSATVSWTAPTSTGATALGSYTVWCSAAGGSYTSCGTTNGTSLVVNSLTNGTSYTFEVTAGNSAGAGPLSAASPAVTPLAPGTAPAFGPVTATVTGFTTTISNFVSGTGYSATASNHATVTISGSTITVTGLSNGATSHLVVTATATGQTTTSTSLDGAALVTGIAPIFSGDVSTTDGFTFTITNPDAGASYAVSADHGASASIQGSTVTVTSLPLGGTATVTVTVTKPGSTIASAVNPGAAMVAGTAPTFSGLVSTADGFRFQIANFDSGLDYSTGATGSAAVSRSGSTVTVTGLDAAASSTVTVTATKPGVSTASAEQTGSALLAGTAPTVSTVTSTVDGFRFDITNPDLSAHYSVASDLGHVALSGTTVTVTGLSAGQSASVTVTDDKTGYVSTQTVVNATALLTGITPQFSAPTRTDGGYTFTISNFDAGGSYAVTVPGASGTVSGATVTVSGLSASQSVVATVTASHSGYTDASATQSGSALDAGTAPTFQDVVATSDGFTFAIANYDPALSYSAALDPATGVVTIAADGTGIVSGETAGSLVTLTVTALDPGTSIASASTSATVLVPTTAIQLSGATPLAGGYRFTIVNYDGGANYTFSQTAGGVVNVSAATVTIDGLGAGIFSETTVTASSAGHTAVSATVGGTSFPSGSAPAVSAVTRTDDGFTFDISTQSGTSYSVTSAAGTATLSGSTVTVTGLAAGATTTVHLTASVPGVLDATTDVAGTAIAAGIPPALGAPLPSAGGYVLTITNYSSAFHYTLSSSAGTATQNGARVTVAGLAAGAAASLTVVASRGGYRDASSSISGRAMAAPSAPSTPSAPVPDPPASSVTSADAPASSSSPATSDTLKRVVESSAGSAAVQKDGGSVTSKLSRGSRSVTVTTADGLSLRVQARHGSTTLPLAADGVVEVQRDGQLYVAVSGLGPVTDLQVWSMSRTTKLGTAVTDAAGRSDQVLHLPRTLTPGVHTIVVTGVAADGTPVTLQLGIRVLDTQSVAAVSPLGSGLLWILLLVIILLIAVSWFVVARRRRRADDRDERV
jgi:titin